jgi:hypothetical protein
MISFSDGLAFEPRDVEPVNPNVFSGVIPYAWTKVKMVVQSDVILNTLINKIALKSSERVATRLIYRYSNKQDGFPMIVAFENEDDAIVFKIRGLDWYLNAD